MIVNTYSIHLVLLVSVVIALLAGSVAQASQPAAWHPALIEVFTTIESPVTSDAAVNRLAVHSETELHVYDLDGIQRIEAKLSKDLTADHAQSKQVVLQRIQQLTKADSARIQRAAIGLAKAMQYGIDRYPAIIFDGKAVVYGVADIGDAFRRYQQWREGQRQ